MSAPAPKIYSFEEARKAAYPYGFLITPSINALGERDPNIGVMSVADGKKTELKFSCKGTEPAPKPSKSTKTTAASTSKKRKADAEASAIDPNSIILPGEEEGEIEIDQSCDQIRRKINSLINSGEMKVTHFQRECGINSNSYGRFMKLKGPYSGVDNQTYEAAFIFFKKRELAGIKPPKKKATAKDLDKFDVSDPALELDGEDEGEVEVYDTCDEIRRKINAHLRNDGVTKASLCRAIGKMTPAGTPTNARSLDDFLKKKGPEAGGSSNCFYGAYVFFEKLRIKQGKPKSKFRQEMENIWAPRGGFPRRRPGYIIVSADSRPYADKYGRIFSM
ncbi:MAG: hypothetical protein M1813_003278 [Trichoglossum hirsutum]|nr:MAG: hypothetical protein M1813_003278 [Trichoglossum hirsutum]